MTGLQFLSHNRASKVDISVNEAELLVRLFGCIHFKRGRLGDIQDIKLLDGYFYLARRQFGIFHALASGLDHAFGGYDPFAAGRPCQGVGFGLSVGIENQLGQALPVPQVDEYQISVVAVRMYPAG